MTTGPIEPPATGWELPDPARGGGEDGDDLVAFGADLEPGTVLAAYRRGLFPMYAAPEVLGWWSPDPRGVLPLDGLRVSRSLARSRRRFEVTVDAAFGAVIRACADPVPAARLDRRVVRRRVHAPPRPRVGAQRGGVGDRRRHARRSSPAASTGSRSAGSSRVSRCSTGVPTRRRWRWSSSSNGSGRRGSAPRRAVADATPRFARRDRGDEGRLPRAARRRAHAARSSCSSPESGVRGGLVAVGGDRVEEGVLLVGVGSVLVLDDADLGELLAQPAVAGVEEAELLAVRDDLREQRAPGTGCTPGSRISKSISVIDSRSTPQRSHTACIISRSRMRSAASNANSWRSRISVAAEAVVELLERQHAERDVARLVAHDVAEQLLEQRLLRDCA